MLFAQRSFFVHAVILSAIIAGVTASVATIDGSDSWASKTAKVVSGKRKPTLFSFFRKSSIGPKKKTAVPESSKLPLTPPRPSVENAKLVIAKSDPRNPTAKSFERVTTTNSSSSKKMGLSKSQSSLTTITTIHETKIPLTAKPSPKSVYTSGDESEDGNEIAKASSSTTIDFKDKHDKSTEAMLLAQERFGASASRFETVKNPTSSATTVEYTDEHQKDSKELEKFNKDADEKREAKELQSTRFSLQKHCINTDKKERARTKKNRSFKISKSSAKLDELIEKKQKGDHDAEVKFEVQRFFVFALSKHVDLNSTTTVLTEHFCVAVKNGRLMKIDLLPHPKSSAAKQSSGGYTESIYLTSLHETRTTERYEVYVVDHFAIVLRRESSRDSSSSLGRGSWIPGQSQANVVYLDLMDLVGLEWLIAKYPFPAKYFPEKSIIGINIHKNVKGRRIMTLFVPAGGINISVELDGRQRHVFWMYSENPREGLAQEFFHPVQMPAPEAYQLAVVYTTTNSNSSRSDNPDMAGAGGKRQVSLISASTATSSSPDQKLQQYDPIQDKNEEKWLRDGNIVADSFPNALNFLKVVSSAVSSSNSTRGDSGQDNVNGSFSSSIKAIYGHVFSGKRSDGVMFGGSWTQERVPWTSYTFVPFFIEPIDPQRSLPTSKMSLEKEEKKEAEKKSAGNEKLLAQPSWWPGTAHLPPLHPRHQILLKHNGECQVYAERGASLGYTLFYQTTCSSQKSPQRISFIATSNLETVKVVIHSRNLVLVHNEGQDGELLFWPSAKQSLKDVLHFDVVGAREVMVVFKDDIHTAYMFTVNDNGYLHEHPRRLILPRLKTDRKKAAKNDSNKYAPKQLESPFFLKTKKWLIRDKLYLFDGDGGRIWTFRIGATSRKISFVAPRLKRLSVALSIPEDKIYKVDTVREAWSSPSDNSRKSVSAKRSVSSAVTPPLLVSVNNGQYLLIVTITSPNLRAKNRTNSITWRHFNNGMCPLSKHPDLTLYTSDRHKGHVVMASSFLNYTFLIPES